MCTNGYLEEKTAASDAAANPGAPQCWSYQLSPHPGPLDTPPVACVSPASSLDGSPDTTSPDSAMSDPSADTPPSEPTAGAETLKPMVS